MRALVDSHCHLDLSQFDDDRDSVLARAASAGVRLLINPGIDLEHSEKALALAAVRPEVYVAVGIHPNSSDTFDAATPARLRELAAKPKVVAVGEIGLDYHWIKVEPAQQLLALQAQLDLAAELGLPVIIHSREANDDVARVLEEWVQRPAFAASPLAGRPLRGVLHAFSGDLRLAQAAYGWGFVLSLGGPVTYQNARELHALVPHLRLDRLMLETDAPYLTPHPWRGQRNEPAHVAQVCQQVARLCGVTPEEVAAATTATALSFFGLEELSGVENAPPLRSVQN